MQFGVALPIESLEAGRDDFSGYISLIDGLCKMGELDFSMKMQIQMVEKGMAPDVFTYISLIQGLSNADLLDEALGSISLMEVLFRQQG